MKAILFFALCTILTIPTVFGQIKIGENPQNIDPSSVLELESSSKVLVITRVSTLEMDAITPQRGGMVYNTDTECIHYYDGTRWINLCDAVDFEVTSDPIVNNRVTISITESEQGYNLEVAKNSILGENIVDGGIGPDDIQDNSIGQDKLAAESVGSSEIRQNAVGSDEIRDGSIVPTDMANFIPRQVLTTDENGIAQWEDANNLQGAIGDEVTITGAGTIENPLALTETIQLNITDNTTTIADHILEDGDTDATNELIDLSFDNTNSTLTISQSATASGQTADLSALVGSDDQTLTLTNELRLQIEDGNEIDLSILNNSGTDNQTLNLAANDELNISSGNSVNLSKYLDNTDEQQLSIAGTRITLTDGGFVDLPAATVNTDNQTLSLAANDDLNISDGNSVNLSKYLDNTDEQQLSISGTRITLTDGGFVDLPAAAVNTDNQTLSLAANDDLNISDGNSVNLSKYLDNTDEQQLSISGTRITLTDGGFVDLPPGTVDTDQQNLSLTGTDLNITNGTGVDLGPILGDANTDEQDLGLDGTFLNISNGEGIDLAPILGGTQNASQVPFTPYITLSAENTQLAIEQLKNELDTATISGGGENPTNELQDIQLAGTVVSLTIPATPGNSIDLDPTFVTETELAALSVDDDDADPENEIELPTGGNSGQVLSTDGSGKYTWVDDKSSVETVVSGDTGNLIGPGSDTGALLTLTDLDPTFVTETELAALSVDDDDADPENEIELPTGGNNGQVLSTDGSGKYTWVDDKSSVETVVSGDAGNLIGPGSDTGALLTLTDLDPIFATNEELTTATTTNALAIAANNNDILDLQNQQVTQNDAIASVQADVDLNEADADTAIALKEDSANKSNDINLADPTDTKFPTELAVKTYVDNQIATVGVTITTDATLTGDGDVNPLGIAPGAVTGGTGGIIADGTITTDDLGDNAVTEAKIAPGANGTVLTSIGGVTQWAAPATSGGIIAMGKVDLNGNGLKLQNSTVTQNGTGSYTVNLTPVMADANYIINLTVSAATGTASPPIIKVIAQTTTSFTVEILTKTNGGQNNFTLTDSAWFYSVMDF